MYPPSWKQKLGYLVLDGALIASAISVAFLWKLKSAQSSENWVHVYLIPFSVLVRLVLFQHFRLYDFPKVETFLVQLYYLTWAGLLASGLDWLVLLVLKSYYLQERVGVSREIIFNSWALTLLGTALWRGYWRLTRRRLGEHIHRVAIVGAGPHALRVRQEIRQFANGELQVVGFISTGEVAPEAKLLTLGSVESVVQTLPEHRIDELIVAPEPSERSSVLELLSRCEQAAYPVKVRLHPDLVELYVGRVALTDLVGLPLLDLPDRWRSGLHLAAKRVADVIVALLGLVVFFIPGLLIALCIKLEGWLRPEAGGPVFFCQQREGRYREPFRLVKFRTMIRTAEDGCGPLLAQKRDPRITRVGHVLRRTGLDELPQLWNILRGEMSLVGPRPERTEFVEQYLKEQPAYQLRFRLRPGVTGLAQIHGHYDSPAASKLRYDLVYLANVSLLLDMKILFRTLQVVLTGRKMQ